MSEEVRLAAGDVELTIVPENGCRIASLKVAGTELLRQGERYGCFPMVPWCGRTDRGRFLNGATRHRLPLNSPPHAIHGTGRDTAWRTARTGETEAAFTYDLAEPWPYPGRVTQTFELTDAALTLNLGVGRTATPSRRRPAGIRGSTASSTAARSRSTSRPSGRRSAARTTSPPAAASNPGPGRGTTASACRTGWTSPSPGRSAWS